MKWKNLNLNRGLMEDEHFSSFPNRSLCEVLDEMRAMYGTHNYAALLGLIEEVQSMGNRMEAALGDQKNIHEWAEKRSKLAKEIKDLIKKKKELKK